MTHAIARDLESQPSNPPGPASTERIECVSTRGQTAVTQGATR